jgi:glycosyltransferase involved in cell wall biosynthesis
MTNQSDLNKVSTQGISVVIPLYNKSATIFECIESVLNQSMRAKEIIVVDDGSTDDGPSIVRSLKSPNVILLSQKNSGVSSARNVGVQAAKSSFVAFLDADDVWNPSHLSTLSNLATAYEDAGVWSTGFLIKQGSSQTAYSIGQDLIQHYFVEEYIEMLLAGRDLVWTSACMARRDHILSLGGFAEGINHGEDHAMWLGLALKFNGAAISGGITANYQLTPDGLSKRLVTRADAIMVFISDYLLNNIVIESRLRLLLKTLFNKFATAHAINAIINSRRDIAHGFVSLTMKTNRVSLRIIILSIILKFNDRWLNLASKLLFNR